MKQLSRIGLALIIALASVPAPVFAQEDPPPPPPVDPTIDKLLQLDPAAVAAKLKEYKEQAAAKEAEAAKMRGEADAKQKQAEALTAQLDAIKARVTALSALFTEAQEMQAAPMKEWRTQNGRRRHVRRQNGRSQNGQRRNDRWPKPKKPPRPP
jgi:chromosome segregation ATPase